MRREEGRPRPSRVSRIPKEEEKKTKSRKEEEANEKREGIIGQVSKGKEKVKRIGKEQVAS